MPRHAQGTPSTRAPRIDPRILQNEKPFILHAFIGEGKSHKQVCDDLGRRIHKTVTKAQLELQLRLWGVRKNLTVSEWQFIDIQCERLRSLGSSPVVRISDYDVCEDRLLRACKRNSSTQRSPSSRCPPGVSIGTYGPGGHWVPHITSGNPGSSSASPGITTLQIKTGGLFRSSRYQHSHQLMALSRRGLQTGQGPLPSNTMVTARFTPTTFSDLAKFFKSRGLLNPVFSTQLEDIRHLDISFNIEDLNKILLKTPFAKFITAFEPGFQTLSRGLLCSTHRGFMLPSPLSEVPATVDEHHTTRVVSATREAMMTFGSLLPAVLLPPPSQDSVTMANAKFLHLMIYSLANGLAGMTEQGKQRLLRLLRSLPALGVTMARFLLSHKSKYAKGMAETLFRAAIESRDHATVKELLESRLVHPDEPIFQDLGTNSPQQWTALQRAAILNDCTLVNILLDANADPNHAHTPGPRPKSFHTIAKYVIHTFTRDSPLQPGNVDYIETIQALIHGGVSKSMTILAYLLTLHFHYNYDSIQSILCPLTGMAWYVELGNVSIFDSLLIMIPENFEDGLGLELYRKLLPESSDPLLGLPEEDAGVSEGTRYPSKILAFVSGAIHLATLVAVTRGKLGCLEFLLNIRANTLSLGTAFCFAVLGEQEGVIRFILECQPTIIKSLAIGFFEDLKRCPTRYMLPESFLFALEKQTPYAMAIASQNHAVLREIEGAGVLEEKNCAYIGCAYLAALRAGDEDRVEIFRTHGHLDRWLKRVSEEDYDYDPNPNLRDINHQILNDILFEVLEAEGEEETSWHIISSLLQHQAPKQKKIDLHPRIMLSAITRKQEGLVRSLFPYIQWGKLYNDSPILARMLLSAREWGNRPLVDILLTKAAQVRLNFRSESSLAALGGFETINFLLSAEAVTSLLGMDGLLQVALQTQDERSALAVLDRIAIPTDDLLKIVVQAGRLDLLRRLLTKCPLEIGPLQPAFGVPALCNAILQDPVPLDIVELLLHHPSIDTLGKRIYQFENKHPQISLALHLHSATAASIYGLRAGRGECLQIAQELLRKAPDPVQHMLSLHYTPEINSYSMTNLFLEAIESGHPLLVESFLNYNPDPNFATPYGPSRTPLQQATLTGNPAIVQLLLDKGANPNQELTLMQESTALQLAARSGSLRIVAMLFEHGANLYTSPAMMMNGAGPLEEAAKHGRFDMMEFLWEASVWLKRRFDQNQILRAINAGSKRGHQACSERLEELMESWPEDAVMPTAEVSSVPGRCNDDIYYTESDLRTPDGLDFDQLIEDIGCSDGPEWWGMAM